MLIDVALDHVLAKPARQRLSRDERVAHHVGEIVLEPAGQRYGKALLRPVHEAARQPAGEGLLEDVLVPPPSRELVTSGKARCELDQLVIEEGRAALERVRHAGDVDLEQDVLGEVGGEVQVEIPVENIVRGALEARGEIVDGGRAPGALAEIRRDHAFFLGVGEERKQVLVARDAG